MTEQWLRKVRATLDAMEPRPDLWERVQTHPPGSPPEPSSFGSRVAAAMVGLLITGGLLIGGWLLIRPDSQVRPAAPGWGVRPPEDEVRVVCGEQTELLTSHVVRHADGVRFRLSNPGGAGALFIRDPMDPQKSWMRGSLALEDFAHFTLPVPAREVLVACLHPPVNTLNLPQEAFRQLVVVSPEVAPDVGPTITPDDT